MFNTLILIDKSSIVTAQKGREDLPYVLYACALAKFYCEAIMLGFRSY